MLGPLSSPIVSGQSQTAPIAETVRIANATRVDHAPKIGGDLDDPLWKLAQPITNFAQREPYEGQPPTERTEVRILYTKDGVFFGIICYDSDPARIVATQMRRRCSQELDDYFAGDEGSRSTARKLRPIRSLPSGHPSNRADRLDPCGSLVDGVRAGRSDSDLNTQVVL